LGQKLLEEGQSLRQVAKALGVHPSTIYRVLRSSLLTDPPPPARS
jgi:IS30 family transposase